MRILLLTRQIKIICIGFHCNFNGVERDNQRILSKMSNQLPLMGAIGHTRLSRRRSGYSDNFQKQVKSLNNMSILLLEKKENSSRLC